MDFLRDGIWQFIGAVFSAAAIGVTIWIFFRQRSRKTLSYGIEFTNILSIHDELKDDLTIIYKDRIVNSAFIVTIVLRNVGDIPITRADFDEPIRITFQGIGELVRVDTSGSTMPVVAQMHEQSSVVISPVLLNKGENINIQAIVVNGFVGAAVFARIIGGNIMSCAEIDNTLLNKISIIMPLAIKITSITFIIVFILTNMANMAYFVLIH